MINYKFEQYDSTYLCYIDRDGVKFFGEAYCHPEDEDMKSERTGYFIAETRANISMLRYIRDHEVIPMLKYYKHFYDCVSHSSKFNKDSYEAKMLLKELRKWEKELSDVREEIKHNRDYLREYIDQKEKLYQKIRKGNNN